MIAPKINIKGKAIQAKEPKIKIWKKMTKLQSSTADMESDEGIDLIISFLADVFDVKVEDIEDNVSLGDFFKLFQEVGNWIGSIVEAKSEQLTKN